MNATELTRYERYCFVEETIVAGYDCDNGVTFPPHTVVIYMEEHYGYYLFRLDGTEIMINCDENIVKNIEPAIQKFEEKK